LEISFENRNLRKLCESQNKAKHLLGEALASKLIILLADLDVMKNVYDLIVGRIHNLKADSSKSITIEFGEDAKFVFCANHLEIPLLANKTVDWSNVTRIKILSIEGNDDKK